MKNSVIYQSKSGYTKRYMDMLLQSIEADLVPLNKANPKDWEAYDTLVYAGGIYVGKISGLKSFLDKLSGSGQKRLVIVGVGASPPTDTMKEKLIQAHSGHDYFSQAGINSPEFFYLQGGFDPDKLKLPIKIMLGMVSKGMVKKQKKNPDSLTEEDKEFLEFFQNTNDYTSKDQLAPLIAFINQG